MATQPETGVGSLMPRNKLGREANLRSSIYRGQDGYWHGRVTVGVRDDGTPDRRHVMSREKAKLTTKVRKLERQRDDGVVIRPGRAWTVERWLTHWLENIARPSVRYKPYIGYRTAVNRHLIPGLGAHRIDRVQPEHFEKLYTRMLARGLKPGTAHQVHRTARTAFGEAFRRGYITRNPVALAKPPRVEDAQVDPFEAEETERILTLALRKRNGVRFVIALALGLRQGEALGLKWARLHEPSKTLEIMKGLQRQTWQHSCADPHACGARYHKVKPCPKNCKRHQRPCPPPCPPNCASHARWCPHRQGGGLVEVEVKSAAGRRGIALPDQLFTLIIEHRKRQDQEREHAGTEWREGGWMFAQPTGKPIDPRRDQYEWKALLEEAGVREARLHDARHTAATTLLLLGVPERAVMDVMGWSNSAMVKRYAHVTARLRRDIADRLNAFLWASNETKNETEGA
jgi:integrase